MRFLTAPLLVLLLALPTMGAEAAVKEPARVAAARTKHLEGTRKLFEAQGVSWPARELFVRVLKGDRVLELWAGDGDEALKLVKRYPICASSGSLGPKLQQGDGQVPEGFYVIDRENPYSSYHLALHVDYPNRADRARGARAKVKDLGGDIMVHGNCVTIGCIPLEDDPIEEVFLAVHDSRARGATVPVHIFPGRLDGDAWKTLAATPDAELVRFWDAELRPGFLAFEQNKRVPRVVIDAEGHYAIKP